MTETLTWGEPAYLTSKPKSGTTIRICWKQKEPQYAAMFVNCNTSLTGDARTRFGDRLQYEGNRAIQLPLDSPLPEEELRIFIGMALCYHLDKK